MERQLRCLVAATRRRLSTGIAGLGVNLLYVATPEKVEVLKS